MSKETAAEHAPDLVEGEGKAAPAAGKSALLLPVLIALVGGLGGGVVAVTVVAPHVIKPAAAAPATQPAPAPAPEPKAGAAGAPGEGAEPGKLVKLEGLIVNPAGSQGTRFLMASVAFETTRPTDQAILQARDVQVRDLVTSLLEKQSIAVLTAPGARDTLRAQLAQVVLPLLPAGGHVNVYISQLVVQ